MGLNGHTEVSALNPQEMLIARVCVVVSPPQQMHMDGIGALVDCVRHNVLGECFGGGSGRDTSSDASSTDGDTPGCKQMCGCTPGQPLDHDDERFELGAGASSGGELDGGPLGAMVRWA